MTAGGRCGLRRAELSGLNTDNIKGNSITIKGKGDKTRNGYLSPIAKKSLNQWLKKRGNEKGALFTHILKGDHVKNQRLGVKGIHYIIMDIYKKCKLNAFTTHDLRRTFATTLLYNNVDVFTVQELLGHADPRTTMIYDRRGESEKIKAINSLPF